MSQRLEQLQDARGHVSAAFKLLDEVGPALPDLERHAALTLKGELEYAIRRLTNLIHFAQRGAA